MKTCFYIVLFFLTATAQATSVIADYRVEDAKIGNLQVVVTNVSESATNPFRLTVTLQCYDRRQSPDAHKPKAEVLLKDGKLCFFERPLDNQGRFNDWDPGKRVLTVPYIKAPFSRGEAKCLPENAKARDFYLDVLCENWQR